MVQCCFAVVEAKVLQDVIVHDATPGVAGTTYELPDASVGWTQSSTTLLQLLGGALGGTWPIVTAAPAGEANTATANTSAIPKPEARMTRRLIVLILLYGSGFAGAHAGEVGHPLAMIAR